MTQAISLTQCCRLYETSIDAGPLMDRDKLDGALQAPFGGTSEVEFFPTFEEKAAKYVEAINTAHAFTDGNKRLSWLMAVTFLELNGLKVSAGQEEAADMVIGLVEHTITRAGAAMWFANHIDLA